MIPLQSNLAESVTVSNVYLTGSSDSTSLFLPPRNVPLCSEGRFKEGWGSFAIATNWFMHNTHTYTQSSFKKYILYVLMWKDLQNLFLSKQTSSCRLTHDTIAYIKTSLHIKHYIFSTGLLMQGKVCRRHIKMMVRVASGVETRIGGGVQRWLQLYL